MYISTHYCVSLGDILFSQIEVRLHFLIVYMLGSKDLYHTTNPFSLREI